MKFDNFDDAYKYFGNNLEEYSDDIEQCEICGKWSVSKLDFKDGEIVGAYVSETGYSLFDKVCEKCSNINEDELYKKGII